MNQNCLALCRGLCAAVTLGMMGLTPVARADVVFSNFGAGDSYDNATGLVIMAPGPNGPGQSVAGSFTVAQNFDITGFDVGAQYFQGSNDFLFSIVSDNVGLPTGSSLFSTSGTLTTTSSINSFAATGSLLAGNTYWLVLQPGANDTFGTWNLNDIFATGYAFTVNGVWQGASRFAPAFRVLGTVSTVGTVPEPASTALMMSGLFAAAGVARCQRRKKAGPGSEGA